MALEALKDLFDWTHAFSLAILLWIEIELDDALAGAPHLPRERQFVDDANADQIGSFSRRDLATVTQPQRLRRIDRSSSRS